MPTGSAVMQPEALIKQASSLAQTFGEGKMQPPTDQYSNLEDLGVKLLEQGKYEAAEEMYRRTLEAREKALGVEHPDTLTNVNNLALVLHKQGKYEVAEEMHRRTLQVREKTLGVEHPDTLFSVNNLALVSQYQGKYEVAEEMHRRALEGYRKVLGVEHPDTLTSINNLALVLQNQGKYEAAEEMLRRVLEAKEKTLGVRHPDTLVSINNLAEVFRDQGKYEAAEEMHRRALEGHEKALGVEHPHTLLSISNLALVLHNQGKYEAAEEMHRRALEGHEKTLGVEHPHTLASINNLAGVFRDQGKYEAAEEMYRRALEGHEKALGAEHPNTLTSISNLAEVLKDQGNYEAAEEMHRRVLETREKALGVEHPDTLTSVYHLAYLLHAQRQYDGASLLYPRAAGGYRKMLGPHHPLTLACSMHYSSMLNEMMDRQLEDMPYSPSSSDAEPAAVSDIFLPGQGYNPEGESALASFVYRYANMDMSWVEPYMSHMLPEDDGQTGLDEEAYALEEPGLPMTRQDFVEELSSLLDGSSIQTEIYRNQGLTRAWPYGDECTSPDDKVCEACAAVRLERHIFANNSSRKVFSFKLSNAKKTAQVPGCPMCRLLLSTFRDSLEIETPPWGDETMILVRFDTFAFLSRPMVKDGQSAVQGLASSGRFYTELIDAMEHKGKETFRDSEIKAEGGFGFQLVKTSKPDEREFGFFGKGRTFETLQASMDLLKDWKRRCLDSHTETCHPSHAREDGFHSGFRVIDVVKRYVLDAPVDCEYITLSYVWGLAKQLLNEETTRERLSKEGGLDDRHEDIPLTIRDAMLLCDGLGFQYIWIDTLCIRQDDNEDRAFQIANMDAVYSKAALTIVALCSTDCNSGLPGVRPDSRSFKPAVETIGGVTLSPIAQRLATSITSSIWDTRGWTLQEKLLSHRALIVTDTQFFWHCAKATWYEDSQLEAPPSIDHEVCGESRWPFMDDESVHPFERYKKLAMSYVHRKFTIESDGLDAVKGILKKLAPGLGGALSWGLPEKYLDVCVMWDWPGVYNHDRLPRAAHFPSWSWVSLSVPESRKGLEGVCWDAITTLEEYIDSNTRMRLGNTRKVCTMVTYYRYTQDGVPVTIESGVYKSIRDPEFREYQASRQVPITNSRVMPIRFYTSTDEYSAIIDDFHEDPLRGIPLHAELRQFIPQVLAFFAESAKFYVSSPSSVDSSTNPASGIQEFQVALDAEFKDVVGRVTLDAEWRTTQPEQLEFVAVARHASNGPHTNLRRREGWFFHCLLVERVFDAEAVEGLGTGAGTFVRKVAVLFDVDCELWERADMYWNLFLMI